MESLLRRASDCISQCSILDPGDFVVAAGQIWGRPIITNRLHQRSDPRIDLARDLLYNEVYSEFDAYIVIQHDSTPMQ